MFTAYLFSIIRVFTKVVAFEYGEAFPNIKQYLQFMSIISTAQSVLTGKTRAS